MSEKDFLWLNLRELPYFRAMLRAVEAHFYQAYELPPPVLDIGCGDGHFATVTFDPPLDVGLDLKRVSLKTAAKRGSYRLLVQADAGRAPFPDAYFGSAVSNSVLEHIPKIELVLSEVARILRPGAPFLFCVPNPGYLSELSVFNFLNRIGLHRFGSAYASWFRWASGVHHVEPKEVWQAWLEQAGFCLEKCWHYFPPPSLRALEWGHYFGLPSLLAYLLFGRWVLFPARRNLSLIEGWIRPYAEPVPHAMGTFTFFVARQARE